MTNLELHRAGLLLFVEVYNQILMAVLLQAIAYFNVTYDSLYIRNMLIIVL